MCLEEGEELSDELVAQLGKYDQVLLRFYPAGYMPEAANSGQVMSCWVDAGRGKKKPLVVRQYGVDISEV